MGIMSGRRRREQMAKQQAPKPAAPQPEPPKAEEPKPILKKGKHGTV